MSILKNNLYIYNSLSRKKEKFEPLKQGFVGMYVCGPTVYGDSHLGHAKSYISFDIIVRYLRFLGYKVRYVQNITDVGHLESDADEGEDKISEQARLERLEPMEIVENYTRSYFEDMDILNIIRPDISPRASGHIPEQIEMIEKLITKGFAYEANGNVYFSVEKFSDYGKLSGRSVEDMKEGHRVSVQDDKKNSADFALWKKADPSHIMQWHSPWGNGYPGWHLECSCMSGKYLGETFDIHGGGMENKFPHHESEIAQSEAANDKPFARYWIHNNMVTVDGVKMGKSLGNFTTIKKALETFSPLAIRYFILGSHYGSTLDFSNQAIEAAEKGLQKIHTFIRQFGSLESVINADDTKAQQQLEAYKDVFQTAMDDDFNTPRAIAATFDFMKAANSWIEDRTISVSDKMLELIKNNMKTFLGDILGILPETFEEENSDTAEKFNSVMQLLLDLRDTLRKEKNFALADEIRNRLTKSGIVIKDTPDGSNWR